MLLSIAMQIKRALSYRFRRAYKYVDRYLLAHLLKWIIYFISGLFPRNGRLWLFGTIRNGFSDNAKYLFVYASENIPGITAIWVSEDPQVLARVNSMGFSAVPKWSLKGIWLCLRAKYYLYTHYVSDINFFTSKGATLINMWHGSPLKRIEFDVTNGPSARHLAAPTWQDRLLYRPEIYVRPTFVLSASHYVSSYALSSAFRIPLNRCVELGYPRLDTLYYNKETLLEQLKKSGDIEYVNLLERLSCFKRFILYLPTWRDSGVDFLKDCDINVKTLEALCEEFDAVFIVKLHQFSKTSELEQQLTGLQRVMMLRSELDIYPLLSQADVLITDYSSVMFEFILTAKPIVIFAFDLKRYVENSREFYIPFEKIAIGTVTDTADGLYSILRHLLSGSLEPNYCDEVVWRYNRFRDGNACQRICDFLLARG